MSVRAPHTQWTVNLQWFSWFRVTLNHASCCTNGSSSRGRKCTVKRKVCACSEECLRVSQSAASVPECDLSTVTHTPGCSCNPNCSSATSRTQTTLWPHLQRSSPALWLLHHFTHIPLDFVYCCFTHFAYTINYGYRDLNKLQAAGFIFQAKLLVNNSVHQLLHLDLFLF